MSVASAPQAQAKTAAHYNADVEQFFAEISARRHSAIEARRLPVENIEAMRGAGLYRMYNPKRFDGAELHMDEVLPVVARIAEACPASAWVLAVYQIHN